MDLSVVPYTTIKSDTDHQDDNNALDTKTADKNHRFNADSVPEPVVMNPKNTKYNIKYRECMRNHAASIGGHANDGCGEFMPCGKDNTREVLTCAACGCHRNFHRREVPGGEQHHHHHHLMHIPTPPPPPKMLLYNAVQQQHHRNGSGGGGGGGVMAVDLHDHHHHDDDDQYDRRSETPERGEVNVGSGTGRAVRSKRQRTKFTQEQKDRMLAFAERIGWRIHRHDDVALNQFCSEIGVKRNVLKVWMHNNKNAYRRREAAPPQSPPVAAPAAPPPPPPPPQPVGV